MEIYDKLSNVKNQLQNLKDPVEEININNEINEEVSKIIANRNS